MIMEDVFHGAIDLCGGGGVRDMWRHDVWIMLGSRLAMLGTFLGHVGIMLGSFLASSWGQFWIMLGSFGDHVGIILITP